MGLFRKGARTRALNPFLKWGFGILAFCFFAACGFGLTLMSNERIVRSVAVGHLKIGGLKTQEAARFLKKRIEPRLSRKITFYFENRKMALSLDSLGIAPDYRKTAHNAYMVGRSGSIRDQIATRIQVSRTGRRIPLQFANHHQTLLSFYRLLEATMGIEPVRSIVKVTRNGEVSFTSSKKGRIIDRAQLLALMENAALDPTVQRIQIPVKIQSPALTEAEINAWSLNNVLGFYVTRFDPTAADRVHNLKMACGGVDNILVYPSQKFSFNTWVGPRVSSAGYREAPVIFMGKLVAGIGGGVCQVSSTLYNAVLLANLKVVERYNHTLPSSYVPLARDATLVDGGLDFIFENTNSKPVLITARVEESYVIVAILGEKAGWEKVLLETVILKTYPTWVKETPDPTLPLGQRVKVEPGKEGYKAELWRTVVFKDGTSQKTRVNTSIYPAQPEEYKVGTKQVGERLSRFREIFRKLGLSV